MIAICLFLTTSTVIGIMEYIGAEKERDKKLAIALIGISVSGSITFSLMSRVLG